LRSQPDEAEAEEALKAAGPFNGPQATDVWRYERYLGKRCPETSMPKNRAFSSDFEPRRLSTSAVNEELAVDGR